MCGCESDIERFRMMRLTSSSIKLSRSCGGGQLKNGFSSKKSKISLFLSIGKTCIDSQWDVEIYLQPGWLIQFFEKYFFLSKYFKVTLYSLFICNNQILPTNTITIHGHWSTRNIRLMQHSWQVVVVQKTSSPSGTVPFRLDITDDVLDP